MDDILAVLKRELDHTLSDDFLRSVEDTLTLEYRLMVEGAIREIERLRAKVKEL